MKKTIILYALLLAGLVALMKFLQYRYWIRDLSLEFYLGIVALVFTGLGVWGGLKLTRRNPERAVAVDPAVAEKTIRQLGLSKREIEVLHLLSAGHSNQEIADKLFVSHNTVKTHLSNLFVKLEVNRRTQALRKAKSLGILG